MIYDLDLKKLNRIHFMGIKGVGMTSLAVIAKQMGKKVSGSDSEAKFITDDILRRYRIKAMPNFDPSRVEKVDLVIATGAHGGKTNIECRRAMELKIPVLMHAQALGLFSENKKVLAVSGCHGKTTTSAMLAWILDKSGRNPSFVVGTSAIKGYNAAGRFGKGEYFVIEADEYMTCPLTDPTPRFLYLDPFISIVTNIDFDHPDRYHSLAETQAVFDTFLRRTSDEGVIVANLDDANVRKVLKNSFKPKVVTYGESSRADVLIGQYRASRHGIEWQVSLKGNKDKVNFSMPLAGKHNAFNATACAAAAVQIGIPLEESARRLRSFQGLKRRFEFVGQCKGAQVYDDYGHHPNEILATLRAARERFDGKRIVVVFQPHTYSRTEALFNDFCQAFKDADLVILPPIFASAREQDEHTITSEQLAEGMRQFAKNVVTLPTFSDIHHYLEENTRPDDVIFTIGAGDVYQIGQKFVANTLFDRLRRRK